MNVSAEKEKKQTFGKLLLLVTLMFGFGFLLVPFYKAICDVTGVNVLAAREKAESSDADKFKDNSQIDISRSVVVEFDSNSHGPWIFKPEKPFIELHPGELIQVNFKVSNPSKQAVTGQAIPSYAPLQAAGFLKKIECFCFEQQKLEGMETRNFPVVFVLDPDLPKNISNITMSYTFFEITNVSYNIN